MVKTIIKCSKKVFEGKYIKLGSFGGYRKALMDTKKFGPSSFVARIHGMKDGYVACRKKQNL